MRYNEIIFEDSPRRLYDESVVEWLNKIKTRPDADSLYIHGSNKLFDDFKDPNTNIGQLIFSSKLTKQNHPIGNSAYQAEYYGKYLYLIKIHFQKIFRPHSNPEAKEILTKFLSAEHEQVWDYERKIEYGRLDYQDLHIIVPVAIEHGFDMFRVYEISIQAESYGATKASMIEIIDIFK